MTTDKPAAPEMIPVQKKPKPKDATTMFEMSQNSVGTDDNSHAFLIGSGGTPPYPPSVWEADIGNIEPPLGEDVNAFEPCGTATEIAASLPPEEEDAPQAEGGDEQATFQRRFL